MNYMKSILAFTLFIISCSYVNGQSAKADSLLKVLPSEIGDTRFDVLSLIYCEVALFDLKEAKKYVDLRQIDALAVRDSFKICENYIQYGAISVEEGDFVNAREMLFMALALAKRHEFDIKLKFIYNHLQTLYNHAGDYDKALQYNFKSLARRKLEGKQTEISVAYNNIGWTYENMKDYQSALEFYKMSYQLKINEKIEWGLVVALANISGIYNELEQYDSGLLYAKKAYKQCIDGCIPNDLWMAHKAMGESYLLLDSIVKAESHISTILKISEDVESNELLGRSLIYLAQLELAKGYIDRCINVLSETEKVMKQKYRVNLHLEILEMYAIAYEKKRDFRMMANYLKQANELASNTYNGDLISRVASVSVAEVQQNNNATIETQKELLSLRQDSIAQQKLITFISYTLIGLLLVVAVMLWYGIRARKHANILLNQKVKERTKELDIRNTTLVTQTYEQKAIMDKLNQQLKAFLATMKGLVQTADKDILDPDAKAYLRHVQEEAEKMKYKASLYLDREKDIPTAEQEEEYNSVKH